MHCSFDLSVQKLSGIKLTVRGGIALGTRIILDAISLAGMVYGSPRAILGWTTWAMVV